MTEKKRNVFEEPVEIDVGSDAAAPEQGAGADVAAGPEESARQEGPDELALQEELAKHREAMLRMQAESENLRKRLVRDQERSRKFALEGIMKELLQVRDSMERGLEVDAGSATVESLLEGQALTLRMLGKVMQDNHLEEIDPRGERFNPELHEAMTVLPTDEVEEDTVMEVLQKGFKLHDRLIRPARVVVSRKP